MNRIAAIALAILLSLSVTRAGGHGTPIHVGATTSLIASGGVGDSIGYAPMLFYESTETGDPFATLTLPSVGPVVIWQLPGFEITGLSTTSSLSIEVLSRPVNNVLPVQQRALWYWNPATSLVAPTSSPLYFLGTNQRFTTIDPAISTAPAPFLLADPIGGTQAEGGQQGFHNHGLLSYALDNSPTAPAGAYGFFARLISNQYAPSDPFLIVLNHGVDYERMSEAALAINAAAFLPGDFDHNDLVDAADYVKWRNAINTTEEYSLWRGAFGASISAGSGASAGGAGMGSGATNVPEPRALLIAASIFGLATIPVRQRRRLGRR